MTQLTTVADPGFANGRGEMSSAGARIEASKAPSGRAPQARVSRRRRRREGGVWGGSVPLLNEGGGIAPPPEKFSILSLKMATFSAFWALVLQFIVHSSMDCLKLFRRQKPLLVGKLAVVCMQIALVGKTSVLESWKLSCDLCKGKVAGVLGGGIAPPQKIFRF